ncbi:hypothetical protein AVEN_238229-1 [Araneus ventricosus]|uniref:Uncharacterized protein n=1 Tax=Araneus ventricosus TaxID=182803 RepID=A0A4Y2UHF5_ARAVE|nr:hypothetical protein AVEN_238229-1 [Araneus ventricosus]
MLMHLSHRLSAPQFQLHKMLWVAVSSTEGLPVERRHHLQNACLQDVVLVNQTDEKSGWSVLRITLQPRFSPKRFSSVWCTKTASWRQTLCR